MALREVLAKFGIVVEGEDQLTRVDKSVNKAKSSVERLEAGLKTLGTVWAAKRIIEKVKSFVEETVRSADALKHNAERLGISTDELQQYQYAAQLTGVSAEQTAIGIRFFNRAVGEAALGTKAAQKTFAQLGINIRDAGGNIRPTDELLFEFSDKLKNTQSQAVRTAYATRLLGRNGSALLPMLQQGGAALRDMFKDVEELGGGFNKDFVEGAHRVDVQMKRLMMGYRGVKVAIATELLPTLEKMALSGIRNVKLFIDMSKKTYGIRTALMSLVPILALISGIWLAWNYELIPILALFAALALAVGVVYLVVDDLYTSFKGGDSYFTDFLEKMSGKGAALEFWRQLSAAFDAVKDAIFGADGAGKSFFQTLFEGFVKALPDIVSWGGTFLTSVVSAIDTAITSVRELIGIVGALGKGLSGPLKDFSTNYAAGLADVQKNIGDAYEERQKRYANLKGIFENLGKPGAFIDKGRDEGNDEAFGYASPPSADEMNPGRTTGGHRTTIVNNNITIHGATDARKTADQVKGAATKGTKSALATNRDTYAATTAGMPLSSNP